MRQSARHSTPSFSSFNPVRMKSKKIWGLSISLILINLASILEKADEALLPAVYKEVSEEFHAGPTDLGYLTFTMNFVQALSSPIAGILALQYDRPTVLASGTACWAIATAAVGLSQHFKQLAFWRAINGLGLAIVIPVLQSLIADSYAAGSRGAGFGLFGLVSAIGRIGGGTLATIMAGQEYWGIPGWRFAFLNMASVSLLIGILVYLYVVDPRKASPVHIASDADSERSHLVGAKDEILSSPLWHDSWIAMRSVMKIRTFQFIVLQGIVGSIPWTALVFLTMWFELIGFDHKSTAALHSVFTIGCSVGALMGGLIADRLSRYFPDSARIVCAQFSAFMSIPYSIILLTLVPQSADYFFTFAATLLLMGLTISWCSACANSPMFAEVVPLKHRTMIYAFDRAFEGSFSAFAAPAVGMVSERIFGYDRNSVSLANGSTQGALALSRGLLTMTVIPWGLCGLFYTPLYIFFKRDRENARVASNKEEELELK
ncbi:hypothetical protein LUZ61_009164 [Rhynchospora tenuis]|uniref:Major facilitator superfamily (MFS) profile domain-containing protein n=1 Tax=Rhynchospora tenuis TaxID=198213 RepID=A0AAD6EY67_9POAL|nr:hypothetical protein LUZ61_009164 [Rhynchospora tenuis]